MTEDLADSDERWRALVRNGAWLDRQHFPPLSWAVPGLVPEGFGLLVGPPKIGKSWAALGMALGVGAGSVAFGNVPTGRPRPVLYLALEDGDRRLQQRCRTLLGGEPIPALLDYVTRATPAEALEVMSWWLSRHGGGRPLVLLDTLGKVSPPALPGESAYGRDYRIGSRLKSLADDHPGTTLLAVHHDRKAASEDFVESVSGTNGLAGSADFTLFLIRRRQDSDGVLKVTGREVFEGEYAVTSNSGSSWALKGDDLAQSAAAAAAVRSTAGLGDRSTEIVELIAMTGTPMSPSEVAAALDEPHAGRYMARLVEAERLVRVGRGLYDAVPSVRLSDPAAASDPDWGHEDT